jgi:hypothetical protein
VGRRIHAAGLGNHIQAADRSQAAGQNHILAAPPVPVPARVQAAEHWHWHW